MARTEPRPRVGIRTGRARRFAAACLVLPLTAGAASGVRAGPEVRPTRLAYTESILPNGLRLILHEDHSAPIVNVQVWYHVGSKNERPGRTGFAYLLEHLMFKGSKNVQPDQHRALVSSVGGETDAYTTEDVTVYWDTVPSQFLPMVLWLEADRMATPRFEREMFDREREAVKDARRMRIESQPYGRLAEIVNSRAFAVHPYKHGTMGSTADLDAALLENVRAFYRTFYVPNNATVVIAGDIDRSVATDLASRYFGRIHRPTAAVPRDIPTEPPQTSPRRLTTEENWPQPVVVVAHHVTAGGHPDSYPLRMASKILSDGRSSRVYRKLVYETGIALSAAGVGNFTEDPNLFYAFAIVQPGHTADEAEQALVKELDRLRAEPVTERELARAKDQVTRDYVLGRETVQQKASALARAAVLHNGDVAYADAEYDLCQRVTAADIQRVAQAYFAPGSRLVVTVTPKLVTGGVE